MIKVLIYGLIILIITVITSILTVIVNPWFLLLALIPAAMDARFWWKLGMELFED